MLEQNVDDKDLIIVSANLRVDRLSKTVYVDGESAKINGLTYLFLETLLLSNQSVVTQSELADKVWNKRIVSDETITQRASLLRKALGDQDKEYFESIRGIGYQWLKKVEFESPKNEQAVIQAQNNKRRNPTVALSILGLSAAVIVVLVGLMSNPEDAPNRDPAATSQQSLLFQRANQYANQHTESANKIAIQLYQQYLDSVGERPEVLLAYASAVIERTAKFERTDSNIQLASELIDRLEHQNTEEMPINWLKGYFYDVNGNIDKAIEYYEKSLYSGEQPKTRIAGSLGYLYTQRGKLFESLQLNLIALKGSGLYRLLQIAEVLYSADLEPHAANWIEAAYQYAPDDGFTAVQYAKYLFANRKVEDAERVLLDLHELGIESEDSLVLMALIKIDASDFERANSLLEKAISLQPESIYASSMQYWLHRKLFKESKPSNSEYLPSDEDWPNAIIAHSMILISDKKLDQAITQIEKAIAGGFRDYRSLINNPIFSELNKEARFREAVSKMMRSTKAERAKIELLELPELTQILQGE